MCQSIVVDETKTPATIDITREIRGNPAIRETAMSFLPQASASPGFPLDEAIGLLLKIAQDENEDEAFRKQVRMTIYRIIGACQGVAIRRPPDRAA